MLLRDDDDDPYAGIVQLRGVGDASPNSVLFLVAFEVSAHCLFGVALDPELGIIVLF